MIFSPHKAICGCGFLCSQTQFRHGSECVLEYFAEQQGIFEDILDGHLCLLLSLMLQLSTHLLYLPPIFFRFLKVVFQKGVVKRWTEFEKWSGRGFCGILSIGLQRPGHIHPKSKNIFWICFLKKIAEKVRKSKIVLILHFWQMWFYFNHFDQISYHYPIKEQWKYWSPAWNI